MAEVVEIFDRTLKCGEVPGAAAAERSRLLAP